MEHLEHEQQRQLSLDVGGSPEDVGLATFAVSGALATLRELPKGADVRVIVQSADGEIIATQQGYIAAVSFIDHRSDKAPTWTERAHKIKLND